MVVQESYEQYNRGMRCRVEGGGVVGMETYEQHNKSLCGGRSHLSSIWRDEVGWWGRGAGGDESSEQHMDG